MTFGRLRTDYMAGVWFLFHGIFIKEINDKINNTSNQIDFQMFHIDLDYSTSELTY